MALRKTVSARVMVLWSVVLAASCGPAREDKVRQAYDKQRENVRGCLKIGKETYERAESLALGGLTGRALDERIKKEAGRFKSCMDAVKSGVMQDLREARVAWSFLTPEMEQVWDKYYDAVYLAIGTDVPPAVDLTPLKQKR